MELVPIIYKFVLFGGGFILIVLIGFYLASRMHQKKTEEYISAEPSEDKLQKSQIEYVHLKNQLLASRTDIENGEKGVVELKKDKRIHKSTSEKPSGKMNYLKEKHIEKSKPRFSIVNENIKMKKDTENNPEVENEFRFFYRQNYSKTV